MQPPAAILSLIFLFSANAPLVSAIPPVIDALLGVINRRDCDSLCGVDKFLCCSTGSVCATTYSDSKPFAVCTAGNYVANAQVITSLYTEIDYRVRTSVFTVQPTTTAPNLAASTAICTITGQSISCGSVCCKDATEFCYTGGWCKPWSGNSDSYIASYSSGVTAPIRPTTATTTTVAITTTQGFQSTIPTGTGTIPITAASTSTALSGGAIAGIVVGVIVGIILLLTLCFCCCLKAGFDTILAIFGLGKGRKHSSSRETIIEERRYSRYGGSQGAASRRSEHRGWFGGGGGPKKAGTVVSEKRRTSGAKEGGGLAAAALGLAGLWAVLGLRRKQKEKRAPASSVSYSDYTDSYTGTSASE
jgi:hypothetical protein